MNQEDMTAFALGRLEASAKGDPYAWYPATGWVTDTGVFGLALELFGEAPSNSQLDQLARVLFRLGTAGTIEVASFHDTGRSGFPSRPHSQGEEAIQTLVGLGSRKLDVPHNQYGIRLAVGT
jgi:hypothetical protein